MYDRRMPETLNRQQLLAEGDPGCLILGCEEGENRRQFFMAPGSALGCDWQRRDDQADRVRARDPGFARDELVILPDELAL